MATKKAAPKAQVSYAFASDAEANAQVIEEMVTAIGNDWPAYLHIHNRMPMPIVLPGCVRGMYLQHVAAPNHLCSGMYLVANVDKLHKLALEVQALSKMNNFAGGITMVIGDVDGSTPENGAEPIVVLFPAYPDGVYAAQEGQRLVVQSNVSGGTPPYTYTWKLGESVLAGQASANLTIDSFQAGDAGTYSLTASDNKGGRGNASVTISMQEKEPEPEPEPEPTALEVAITNVTKPTHSVEFGASVKAVAVPTGGQEPYSFAWYLNGSATGNSENTLTFDESDPLDGGAYKVEVIDSKGTKASDQFTLEVANPQPIEAALIEGQPTSGKGGQPFKIELVVTGGVPPYRFSWSVNRQPLDSTTNILNIESFGEEHIGEYFVSIEDSRDDASSIDFPIGADVSLKLTNRETTDVVAEYGQPITVEMEAYGGMQPYSFAWTKDGVALNLTYSSYTMENPGKADEGTYQCVVTDATGNTAQLSMTLTMEALAPLVSRITGEGTNVEVAYKGTINLSSAPLGGKEPYAYQWKLNGQAIAGATAGTHTVSDFDEENEGEYTLLVSDLAGDTAESEPLFLELEAVETLEVLITAPSGEIAYETPVTLEAVAQGGREPFAYQWQKDGAVLATETTATLQINSFLPANAGSYTVTVTDNWGGNAQDTVSIAGGEVPRFDVMITAPDADVEPGEYLEIGCATSGGKAPFSFAWKFNGKPLEGGLSGVMVIDGMVTISSFQDVHSGTYEASATDAYGTVATDTAEIRVREPYPVDVTFKEFAIGATIQKEFGSSQTLTALAVGGDGNFTYEWTREGVKLSETSNVLQIDNFTFENAGHYVVTAIDGRGERESCYVDFEMETLAPIVVSYPELDSDAYSLKSGESFTLNASVAGGKAPYKYQWAHNTIEIPGANTLSYTVSNFTPEKAGLYACRVSDNWDGYGVLGVSLNFDAGEATEPLEVEILELEQSGGIYFTVQEGQDLSLTAIVTGGVAPYTYRWSVSGKILEGQATNVLSLPSGEFADADVVLLIIEDYAGSFATEGAIVKIQANEPAAPAMQTVLVGVNQPTHTAYVGEEILVEAVVTGGVPPYSYNWTMDGQPTGTTTKEMHLGYPSLEDSGVYTSITTDSKGTKSAKSFMLSIIHSQGGLSEAAQERVNARMLTQAVADDATPAKAPAKAKAATTAKTTKARAETTPKTTAKRTTK